MKRLNFDILEEKHDVTAYERHYTSSLLSTRQRRNSSPAISTSWPQPWSRGRNTPSELCDFHSQSQRRCWYFRTALEPLSTQIRGRVISLPRDRELLEFFGVRIWQWIYVAFIIWHPGIWQHDRNHIVTTNAQNNYILFEFCPSITNESWTDMHAESTQVPTCWQPACETRLAVQEVSVVEPFLDAANFGHHLSIGILQCYNYPLLLYFSKNEVRVDT